MARSQKLDPEASLARALKALRATPGAGTRLGPKARRKRWEASLTLVSRPAIRELNRLYRKKTYATDVLSFGAPEPIVDQGYLGDLVVCLPVLKEQARAEKHSPSQELDVLLVHGLLHLLGFDHEASQAEARKMRVLEEKALRKLAAGASGHPTALIRRAGSGS